MFDALGEKLTAVFQRLGGKGRLTEKDIDEALKEVRVALLEADVNFRVARDFVAKVEGALPRRRHAAGPQPRTAGGQGGQRGVDGHPERRRSPAAPRHIGDSDAHARGPPGVRQD